MAKKEAFRELFGGKSNQLFAEVGSYFSADGSFNAEDFRKSLRASLSSIKEHSSDSNAFSTNADEWLTAKLNEIINYLDEKGLPEASFSLFKVAVDECERIGLPNVSLPAVHLNAILSYIPDKKLVKYKSKTSDMKTRIMDAALKKFSGGGYHRSTIDDVAELAGVGKGSVYRYFKSKDDLLKSLIVNRSEVIFERINQIFSNETDIVEQIQAAIHDWVRFIANNSDLYGLIQSNIQIHDTNTRDMFFDHVFSKLPMLKERVISLNRLDQVRTSNMTFDTMFFGSFGYVDWVFYKWLRNGKAYNLMDEVPIIIEILLHGSIKEIVDTQPTK